MTPTTAEAVPHLIPTQSNDFLMKPWPGCEAISAIGKPHLLPTGGGTKGEGAHRPLPSDCAAVKQDGAHERRSCHFFLRPDVRLALASLSKSSPLNIE